MNLFKYDPLSVMLVTMISFAVSIGYLACVMVVYDSVDMSTKEILWSIFKVMVGVTCIGVITSCVYTLAHDLVIEHRRKNHILIFDDISFQSGLMNFNDYWKCKKEISKWRSVKN